MQRWIKLPDGRFIDANRIAYIGKVETYARVDEAGTDFGSGYMVHIGTDVSRDSLLTVIGSREEIAALLRSLLGSAQSPAEAAPAG